VSRAIEGFAGFSDEAFEFYEGLRADNSKTYWQAHKQVYESRVRAPMQTLLDGLAPRFGGTPVLFRPYRDVRFSADKSPYKTAQGAFLEVVRGLGYWVQLDAEGVRVGGGFWPHDRAQVARYRAAVDADASGEALTKVVARLTRAGYEIGGDAVRTRPRGVAADHPRLELMRHESLTVGRPVDATESASAAFGETLAADWKKVAPLVEWARTHAAPSD
jgi:uncharacterized protein (TIGR02453 family)